MKIAFNLLLAGIAASVAACEPPPPALSPEFGHSVEHNKQVHIVGPHFAAPDMDGNRAAIRMEQYRTAKTTPVQSPGTTQTTITQPAPGGPK